MRLVPVQILAIAFNMPAILAQVMASLVNRLPVFLEFAFVRLQRLAIAGDILLRPLQVLAILLDVRGGGRGRRISRPTWRDDPPQPHRKS